MPVKNGIFNHAFYSTRWTHLNCSSGFLAVYYVHICGMKAIKQKEPRFSVWIGCGRAFCEAILFIFTNIETKSTGAPPITLFFGPEKNYRVIGKPC